MIAAGIPVIVLETYDQPRAIDLLMRVVRERDTALHQWTITQGLKRAGFGLQVQESNKYAEPGALLNQLKKRAEPGTYALCDFRLWRGRSSCPDTTIERYSPVQRTDAVTVVLIGLVPNQLSNWRA